MRVVITTYNREAMARRTAAQFDGHDVHVYVDGWGKYQIQATQHRMAKPPGRDRYYQVWNRILRDAYHAEWDRILVLPDDFTLVGDLDQLEQLKGDAVALVPIVDKRGRGPCWVPRNPVDLGAVWQTHWVDCCFYAGRDMFEAIGWRIPDFAPDHFETNQSSGVGKYMSLALQDHKIYQATETLFAHGDHDSVMHYQHRKETPL